MRRLAQSLSRGTIAVGDYIDSWYGTDSTLVIYGATDKKKLPMPKNPGILIYGRLDKDNDIDLVLSALERVKDMKKEVKITFLGDGVYRRRAEKVGEVVGFSKKVEKCLMHASLVVSSSYLSMLDALAAGRQVVSVYSNPLKEQYLKKGPMAHLIHIAKDEDSLVQGIIDRLENLKINKQGSVFAKKQTWEKVAKEYLSLWQNKKLR
jgi:glycosyltransferase involved in cell wall biosynthesis